MSVTFAPEATGPDTRVFAVTCSDGQPVGEFVGYSLAYAEAQAHGLVCGDYLCQGYGADVVEQYADGEPVPVNVTNANAVAVLGALGYTVDAEWTNLCGDADADAFLGRVELALAIAPADEGVRVLTVENYTDCGRAAGYVQARLAELRALALACRTAGARVVWG
jgi:hypothetical protein